MHIFPMQGSRKLSMRSQSFCLYDTNERTRFKRNRGRQKPLIGRLNILLVKQRITVNVNDGASDV